MQPNYGRLILLRHASTRYDRRCVPPHDPPLEKTASHDYAACVAQLPTTADWYVSPRQRCQATFALLQQHGAKLVSHQQADWLSEQSYGDWHGESIAQIWQQHLSKPSLPRHNWHFLPPAIRPPNGESFADVIARLTSPMAQLHAKDRARDTVLVTHAMVIRGILGIALGLSPSMALGFRIDPLSITQLTSIPPTKGMGDGSVWRIDYINRCY